MMPPHTGAVDEKSLEILEFPRIREILAGYTYFSAGRELAEKLAPQHDHELISLMLHQASEALSLLNMERGFSPGTLFDIREAAKMASLEGMLEPATLLEIGQTLTSLHELRRHIGKLSEELPLLWDIAGGITELRHIEKDIAACIDASGEVMDTASPALASIRRQTKDYRRQILERLEGIIRSPRGSRVLQENIVTEREGRYVILVKIEMRHEIKGIVHDISNTGATVFVEPTATVGLGNALRELVFEERREVERILRSLSAEVGASRDDIYRNISLAAAFDLALAKARYARNTRSTIPVIVAPEAPESRHEDSGRRCLKLVEARHPLLGDKAVPFSLEIGSNFSVLVITGPNTGGKTVTLKTIGLLSAMAQAGMPIPAGAESRIPIFDSIFADIGDEQSIEQTLSTFSWHMGNIVRITRQATTDSLVLLDELGSSTDPAEGSALARAILHFFLSRATLTVATTHYSDLKAFAHITAGLENASLDFDPVTLAPTYHLTIGIPGGSNAMATASRLGLPAEIINEAKDMLGGGSLEMESLLAELVAEKRKTETLQRRLTAEKEELARRHSELDRDQQRMKDEERKSRREMRDSIVKEAAELHKEIRKAAADLRREKSATGLEQARKTLAEVRGQLDGQNWQPEAEATDSGVINVGDTVRIREAGLIATVVNIFEASQEIEVRAGQTRLRLSLDGVEKAGSVPSPNRAGAVSPERRPVVRTVSLELDLRGKRADEVETTLDAYLNEAVRQNITEARIIHGYGTGTVRSIVRDFLASHPLTKSFRSGERDEGGDGVTVVSL